MCRAMPAITVANSRAGNPSRDASKAHFNQGHEPDVLRKPLNSRGRSSNHRTPNGERLSFGALKKESSFQRI